ncbi:MAG: hypothetical protein LBE91_21355 [Tannerella sp.]|jgi:hypothetical protein|nr:hypothetical protein [Tannerella sp.]
MIKIKFIKYIFLFFLCFYSSCQTNNEWAEVSFIQCDTSTLYVIDADYKVIKVLTDEPAYIEKRCKELSYENEGGFTQPIRIDTFYLRLVNEQDDFFSIGGLFPCGEIPEQYRKDNLAVYISGNVTNALVLGGCSESNIKVPAIPVIELKAIKIKNNKD